MNTCHFTLLNSDGDLVLEKNIELRLRFDGTWGFSMPRELADLPAGDYTYSADGIEFRSLRLEDQDPEHPTQAPAPEVA